MKRAQEKNRYILDWLNSRSFDFPRECGKNDPFPAGSRGKCEKGFCDVKVANFWQKGQKVQGSKLNIFGKEWKRVQHPLS